MFAQTHLTKERNQKPKHKEGKLVRTADRKNKFSTGDKSDCSTKFVYYIPI